MDIITIAKDFFKCKSLQEWVNNRYFDDNIFRYHKAKFLKNVTHVITKEGIKLRNTPMLNNIIGCHYNYDDLNKDDIVLVLGACEGDCLVFADKVKRIIAVEPIHYEILKENIALNNIKNVDVYECGLGEGTSDIEYYGKSKDSAPLYSLTELIIRSNLRPSVLICDVQGYEHYITSQELKQFRIVEMETHVFKTEYGDKLTLGNMRQKFYDAGFEFDVTENVGTSEVIHARKLK